MFGETSFKKAVPRFCQRRSAVGKRLKFSFDTKRTKKIESDCRILRTDEIFADFNVGGISEFNPLRECSYKL